jgi:DNA-binding CsgD family transcriptional regulator
LGYLGTSLSLAQENGDGQAASISQMELGMTAEMQGDDVTAARWFTLAADGNRTRNDRRELLFGLVNLGDAQFRLGNLDDSLQLSQEALLLSNAPRELQLGCLVRGNLGRIALLHGDLAETWKWFEAVRDLALESRNDLLVADMLSNMAGLALAQHRRTDCGLLLGASRAFCERFGSRMVSHHGLQRRTLESLRKLMSAATLDLVLVRGEELTLEDALVLVERLRVQEEGDPTFNALLSNLTEREQAVLALLATGKSNRGIGEELFISHRTVMRHVASIFKKLAVNDRAAAAIVLASQEK